LTNQQDAEGRTYRWKVTSLAFKGESNPAGTMATWVIGEPAARAIAVLEQLQPPSESLLFAHLPHSGAAGPAGGAPNRAVTTKSTNAQMIELMQWINTYCSAHNRDDGIPTNDGTVEQCLKSVDRLGKGRTFPGDRMKVPSKTGAVTLVGKVRPMLTVVSDSAARDGSAAAAPSGSSLIDELVREGAQRMLAEALQAEVDAYCARFADERDENGRRVVVRNGYHDPREVTTCAGAVAVHAPRVNDKRIDPETGERQRFSSAILPPWARKTPQIEAVLPLLYLHGLSSGDFVPALGQFLGSTKGLSSSTITKMTETWQAEQKAFAQRDLSSVDYVYVWADGIHVNVRLEEARLCLLVLIGVRADGRKELIALTDGYREATESWADLLRDAKRRGMRAPVLAIGDGALGFWGALREVFPDTREQRCWFHKIANVLAALPKSAYPGAKKALAEIWNAEDKRHALDAVKAFETAYGAKFPKAVAKITDDVEQLLAFYDFPAEHWVHLRTTNPIESTFATVRNRSKITKGPGSRAAGIAMAYKLIEAAQSRWRAVNAPHLVALVRAGAKFENGKLVERPDDETTTEEAA
jgi:transposase-like protein